MNTVAPRRSHSSPAAWTNRPGIVERWLRGCRWETALIQLIGGVMFLIAGLLALVVTALVTAFLLLTVAADADGFFSLANMRLRMLRPVIVVGSFVAITALAFVGAWKRRGDRGLRAETNLAWEFLSAGPILLIMAGEDLYTFVRLMEMDLRLVAKVLLWLFDRGGRATFAEIHTAFPGLNLVRVLPQLRDLPGVNRWTDEDVVSLSQDMLEELAKALGEERKQPSNAWQSAGESEKPAEQPLIFNEEVVAWYRTLELPPFASMPQVKKSYKRLAKIHHPDARATNRSAGGATSDEQIKRINLAYHSILKYSREHPGEIS